MSARSLVAWCLGLVAGLVVLGVGLIIAAAFLVLRTLPPLLASALQGVASYVYFLAALEILMAGVIWATRGPILAISWVVARVTAWRTWF